MNIEEGETNFAHLLSSTVNDGSINDSNAAPMEVTPIAPEQSASLSEMEVNNSTPSRPPPALDIDPKQREQQRAEAVEIIRRMSRSESEKDQDESSTESDSSASEEEKEGEEEEEDEQIEQAMAKEMVPRIIELQQKLSRNEELINKREKQVRKLAEEKKELLVIANNLLVQTEPKQTAEIGVGPDSEMREDIAYLEPTSAVATLEEGRWVVDVLRSKAYNECALQVEMGPTGTLRNRERITGENKERRSRKKRGIIVGDDWEGRKEKLIKWEDMERKSRKIWRRRIAKANNDVDQDILLEMAKAEEHRRRTEEGGEERMELEEEPPSQKKKERVNSTDSGVSMTRSKARKERKREERREREELTRRYKRTPRHERRGGYYRGQQNNQHEDNDNVQPSTSTGRASGVGLPTPHASTPTTAARSTDQSGPLNNDSVLFGDELDRENQERGKGHSKGSARKGFDARQKLSNRETEQIDDAELQRAWIMQETVDGEALQEGITEEEKRREEDWRREEVEKVEKRKRRDERRKERREEHDQLDRQRRKRVREEKMKDDEKERKRGKQFYEWYKGVQREEKIPHINRRRNNFDLDNIKITADMDITVTTGMKNYIFYSLPRPKLTHEYDRKEYTDTRRDRIRNQRRDKDRRREREEKGNEEEKEEEEEEAIAQNSQGTEGEERPAEEADKTNSKIDEDDRAPVRRRKEKD